MLITNDIDHEKIHVEQLLEARYEARITPSQLHRLKPSTHSSSSRTR